MRGLLLVAASLALSACTESRSPGRPDGPARPGSTASATSGAPASAASAAPVTKDLRTPRERRRARQRLDEIKARMPEAPPRPAGEPQSAQDMQKLSKAAEDGAPVKKPGAPPIERINETQLRVGRVLVDRAARRVEIPARVNMTKGILEYYGVSSNGKLHESVLELAAEPSHLHLGLILLGVEQIKIDYGDFKKKPVVLNPGGRLRMYVEFVDPKTDKKQKIAAEQWLYSRKAKGAPKPLLWTFQGSTFWNNRYGADMDRSVIALIPDQVAVIGTTDTSGNPYQGEMLGYEVHTQVIPPKGTPVTLIFEVAGDGKTPPK